MWCTWRCTTHLPCLRSTAPSGIDSATESCLSPGQPLWGQPTSNDYWGRSIKDWALWHIMEQCDRPLQVRSSPKGWPRLWGLRHSPAACSAQSSFFPELLTDIVPWHSLTNILCTNLYHRVSFLGNKICNNSVTHQWTMWYFLNLDAPTKIARFIFLNTI